jgi:pyridoxine 5-phosphate synthase
MRGLVASLDAAAAMRDAGGREEPRLAVAAMAVEMAGADGVRLGVNEGLRPVREGDLHDVRRTARDLELRLAPTPSLLKLVLEVRPDRVLLAAEPLRGAHEAGALDPAALRGPVHAAVRALREAGIPAWARLAPDLEAVKAARGADVAGVELVTTALVDLPEGERAPALERFGDAARLAAKLRLPVRAGGALDARRLRALLAAAPVVEGVTVGRELAARALLVGIDRAVRDLRTELG